MASDCLNGVVAWQSQRMEWLSGFHKLNFILKGSINKIR